MIGHTVEQTTVFDEVKNDATTIYYPEYMVLILGGNLEIGAHVRSNLCYLICLRHWIKLQ